MYYTIEEVAAILRVNAATIRKEIHAGRLHAFRVGRHYRITEAQLHEYTKGA